ncbi:hypothetical protein B0H13DRAFT_2342426 [Mycena leptocephala]|nr:hypothetical protein B0H13DRAFT_2342426 [Mycena leptocephala]
MLSFVVSFAVIGSAPLLSGASPIVPFVGGGAVPPVTLTIFQCPSASPLPIVNSGGLPIAIPSNAVNNVLSSVVSVATGIVALPSNIPASVSGVVSSLIRDPISLPSGVIPSNIVPSAVSVVSSLLDLGASAAPIPSLFPSNAVSSIVSSATGLATSAADSIVTQLGQVSTAVSALQTVVTRVLNLLSGLQNVLMGLPTTLTQITNTIPAVVSQLNTVTSNIQTLNSAINNLPSTAAAPSSADAARILTPAISLANQAAGIIHNIGTAAASTPSANWATAGSALQDLLAAWQQLAAALPSYCGNSADAQRFATAALTVNVAIGSAAGKCSKA